VHFVRLLRTYPVFAIFLLSEALSLAGDWFGVVAVSVLALEQGSGTGAFAVGVTLALHDLPMAVVRPFAGVLADRFDRRSLLIAVHVVQGLLTLGMTAAAVAGLLPVVQLLVLVRSVIAGFDWPARSGAIRRLVGEADLLDANAAGGIVWSTSFAVGMSLGGVVASYGPSLALGVDAASFFVAAALLLALPRMPTAGAEGLGHALRKVASDLAEAVRVARGDPRLLEVVLAKAPFGLAGGAGVVLINLVADAHPFAGTGPATLGVLQAVRGVGTGIFPLLASAALRRGLPVGVAWSATAVLGFGGMLGFGLASAPAAFVAATLVWGGGIGANWMIASAELQRRASDAVIGRLSGLDIFLVELLFGSSALLGGFAYERWGTWGALGISVSAGVALWLAVHAAPLRAARAG
jgi:MFS family permease